MRFLKSPMLWIVLVVVAGVVIWRWPAKSKAAAQDPIEVSLVKRGDIAVTVEATALVKPENRLEIKPPLSGRAEDVLVDEGKTVKKGDVLAWMSSNERAALLDAALAKGSKEYEYWKEIYKAAPLVAPLDGIIIAKRVVPGQVVGASDTVFVMSDYLIVQADMDETDLAKIRVGMPVEVKFDAFPGQSAPGKVSLIAFEAVTVNNVTTYKVEVILDRIPDFARSGLTSTVIFRIADKKGTLLLPAESVRVEKGHAVVMVQEGDKPVTWRRAEISTGLTDGKQIEVVSGLREGDQVARKVFKAAAEEKSMGLIPKFPAGRRH